MCRASYFLLYRRVSSAWGRTLPFLSNGNRSHAPIRHIRSSSLSCDSQQGVKTAVDSSEFKKWHNGGGWIHTSAKVEPTVVVEIGAVVHSGSVLGANVHLGSGAIVGPDVEIGQATKIGYNASLCNCAIGDHCIIHNGVSIGQDGFGFDVVEGRMLKKPQVGELLHARIGNHVEIGANSCIDRGSWRDTIIGDHSKIDNLVQIGHNVVIGRCCMLCGQVGIAGSVTLEDYVTLGGRVAVRDHVSIVSKVRLAANSCVTKSINEPGDYGGFPAVPIREWRKQIAKIRQITKMPQSPK
ncbi:putative UDP-3-O-acylglucosamine N-acyltransferase 2 [Nymphaea thermarum]|nr:putative UDP-3-O-acylglucosamine N-acyltransferase 2 [Nymphaea thermarum]